MKDNYENYHQGMLLLEMVKQIREDMSKMSHDMSEVKADQRALATLADQVREIQNRQAKIELIIREEQHETNLKVKALEVKSAVYGTISGAIITLIGFAVNFVK